MMYNIIHLIPEGSRNCISKDRLVDAILQAEGRVLSTDSRTQQSQISGIKRNIQKQVAAARDEGVIIISLSKKKGYFKPIYPADAKLVKSQIEENEKRAIKVLAHNKPMKSWLSQYEPIHQHQEELEV